jgi:hypothetical protein
MAPIGRPPTCGRARIETLRDHTVVEVRGRPRPSLETSVADMLTVVSSSSRRRDGVGLHRRRQGQIDMGAPSAPSASLTAPAPAGVGAYREAADLGRVGLAAFGSARRRCAATLSHLVTQNSGTDPRRYRSIDRSVGRRATSPSNRQVQTVSRRSALAPRARCPLDLALRGGVCQDSPVAPAGCRGAAHLDY